MDRALLPAPTEGVGVLALVATGEDEGDDVGGAEVMPWKVELVVVLLLGLGEAHTTSSSVLAGMPLPPLASLAVAQCLLLNAKTASMTSMSLPTFETSFRVREAIYS